MPLTMFHTYVKEARRPVVIWLWLQSIVGVAGGSTRAALTLHQARRNNMADVSAKDGSQETLVNLAALVCSLLMVPIVADHHTWVLSFNGWILIVLTCCYLYMWLSYCTVSLIVSSVNWIDCWDTLKEVGVWSINFEKGSSLDWSDRISHLKLPAAIYSKLLWCDIGREKTFWTLCIIFFFLKWQKFELSPHW